MPLLVAEGRYYEPEPTAAVAAGETPCLRETGLDDTQLARIHGPIGLAIGAKSPAEIALAILAQATQVLRGVPPLVAAQAAQ